MFFSKPEIEANSFSTFSCKPLLQKSGRPRRTCFEKSGVSAPLRRKKETRQTDCSLGGINLSAGFLTVQAESNSWVRSLPRQRTSSRYSAEFRFCAAMQWCSVVCCTACVVYVSNSPNPSMMSRNEISRAYENCFLYFSHSVSNSGLSDSVRSISGTSTI